MYCTVREKLFKLHTESTCITSYWVLHVSIFVTDTDATLTILEVLVAYSIIAEFKSPVVLHKADSTVILSLTKNHLPFVDCLILRMKVVRHLEKFVIINQSKLSNISEILNHTSGYIWAQIYPTLWVEIQKFYDIVLSTGQYFILCRYHVSSSTTLLFL